MPASSTDLLVQKMIGTVCKKDFTYNGELIEAGKLTVYPGIFRKLNCLWENCGACCIRITLDYLPATLENHPYHLDRRTVEVNGVEFSIYSDLQEDRKKENRCRHVQANGGCGIYQVRPLSCRVMPLRFSMRKEMKTLNHQLFGRLHQYRRVDGERGGSCYMSQCDDESLETLLENLIGLATWAEYLKIDTHLLDIIEWAGTGPHVERLVLGADESEQFAKSISSE